MTIFFKTLREEFLITLIFSIILILSIFLVIQEFSIARQLDFSQFVKNVPGPLKKIAETFLVLNVFGGYLHIVASVAWVILTSIYVCLMASGLISREVENKTMGLLLAHPVGRIQVILEKYAAAVLYLLIITFSAFLGFYLGTYHGSINVPYKVYRYLIVTVNGFAFFLCLAAVSLFFSVLFNQHKKAAAGALLVFMLSYLSFFLGAFSPRWAKIKKYTLFKFFNTEKLFMTTEFQWENVTNLLIISLIFLVLAVILFKRKDIVT